jgi:hypothetical protein
MHLGRQGTQYDTYAVIDIASAANIQSSGEGFESTLILDYREKASPVWLVANRKLYCCRNSCDAATA